MKNTIARRLFFITVASIFISETIVMFLVPLFFPDLSRHIEALVDALMLVLMVIPLLYFFFYLPLKRQGRERQAAEEALRLSEAKFSSVFKLTPIWVTISTLNEGRYIEVNDTFLETTGYRREEVIGHTVRELGIWVDFSDRDRMVKEVSASGQTLKEEVRFRMKSGDVHTVLRSASLIDLHGTPCLINVTQDITDRKQMEVDLKNSLAEKEMLIREIYHRVKNNLMVVTSLLSLQSGHIDDKQTRDMFHESENRVHAMSMIHERLYLAEDLLSINVGEYIRNLSADLFAAYQVDADNVSLRLDISDIDFDVDTMIPCGLIINELISNALKYAFPGGRGGVLNVVLKSGTDGRHTLVVSDDGVGIPEDIDISNTESFGLQIVQSAVKQMDGTIELDLSGGTEFRITFKEKKYA